MIHLNKIKTYLKKSILVKKNLMLVFIVVVGLFLRIYRLSDLMVFIGDQGWFYLSARDLILEGKIPLVGITSSHTWLHQGPLWTYLLSIALFFTNFNPIGGAYVTIFMDTLTIWVLYKLGKELFSDTVGLISAAMYSVSPLAIIHARMPYHTSPIPLFVSLFLLALYKWKKGNVGYFPFVIFLLALLYNFELATFILPFILLLLIVHDLVYKRPWVIKLLDKKIILWSIVAFVVPMTPILIYDIFNGFKQTVIFLLWIPYSALKPLFISSSEPFLSGSGKMFDFIYLYNQRFIFLPNGLIALTISLSSIFYVFFKTYKDIREKKSTTYIFMFLCFVIPLIGLLVNRTSSEAYLPMFFPMIVVIVAVSINALLNARNLSVLVCLLFILLLFGNATNLISKNYLMDAPYGYGPSFSERLQIVEKIIKDSDSKKYQLIGMGEGSKFESFTMNYQYLLWWKHKSEPVEENVNKAYYIEEKNGKIIFTK